MFAQMKEHIILLRLGLVYASQRHIPLDVEVAAVGWILVRDNAPACAFSQGQRREVVSWLYCSLFCKMSLISIEASSEINAGLVGILVQPSRSYPLFSVSISLSLPFPLPRTTSQVSPAHPCRNTWGGLPETWPLKHSPDDANDTWTEPLRQWSRAWLAMWSWWPNEIPNAVTLVWLEDTALICLMCCLWSLPCYN